MVWGNALSVDYNQLRTLPSENRDQIDWPFPPTHSQSNILNEKHVNSRSSAAYVRESNLVQHNYLLGEMSTTQEYLIAV